MKFEFLDEIHWMDKKPIINCEELTSSAPQTAQYPDGTNSSAFAASVDCDVFVNPLNITAMHDLLATRAAQMFSVWCSDGSGVVRVSDHAHPAKLEVSFVSVIPSFRGFNPYWILKTDYDGYAVIYGCRQVLANGQCEPFSVYIMTINRKETGHEPHEQTVIDATLKRVCVDPNTLSRIDQDGTCVLQRP